MNKYKLNYLRFLTQGQIPDEILKKSYDWNCDDNKFKFKFN